MDTAKGTGQPPDNLADYRPGGAVTREEIKQILANDAYAPSERETWLKSLLTDISQHQGEGGERDSGLVDEIEAELDRLQTR